MNKPPKKRTLTDEERRECAALNAIYKAKKKTLGVTQELIAIEGLKASSQSAASHYLTGRNALNSEAASVFAKYLQVDIEDFSPRLAQEIAGMAKSVHAAGAKGIAEATGRYTADFQDRPQSRTYQGDRYQDAPPQQRQAVDEIAEKMLALSPEQAIKLKQAMELLMPADDRTKD